MRNFLITIIIASVIVIFYALQPIECVDLQLEVEPLETEVLLDTIIGTPSPCVDELKVIVNQNDLENLAHIINAEAGTEYATQEETDEMQRAVGSVVINRKNHPLYPNTIEEVIKQTGQYSTVKSGAFDKEPSKSAYKNAEWLLINGSVLPDNVLYQANFVQGKTYKKIKGVYFGYREEK